jgi:large subunit ribosomal protein L10
VANETILKQKQIVVKEIESVIQDSAGVVFSDYRGLSVSELSELRTQLRKEDGAVKVYKNTLLSSAASNLKLDVDEAVFSGPTALAKFSEDAASGAKVLVSFSKKNDKLQIKGGVLNNKFLSVKDVKYLASLPTKPELIAKVVGGVKSPLTNLHMVLSSPLRSLVYVLNSIKDNK